MQPTKQKQLAALAALSLLWAGVPSLARAAAEPNQELPASLAEETRLPPPTAAEHDQGDEGNRGWGGWQDEQRNATRPLRRQPPQGAKQQPQKKKIRMDERSLRDEVFLPDQRPLSQRERRYMSMTRDWESRDSLTNSYMEGGKLVFVYGAAGGVPVIIAAPLQVVDIELEPGENVNEIVVGDSARWQVERGTAANRTHIFVKPVDTGLETSVVVTTDKRAYHWRFISRLSDYMPYVGFAYPQEMKKQQAKQAEQAKKEEKWKTTDSGIDLAALNFHYRVEGKALWKPERVYDNGIHMYIQLPPRTATLEMPALMVKKGKKDVLVNYRVRGHAMEVDGLFPHLALVVGVGSDQELVEIFRLDDDARKRRNFNEDEDEI